MSRQEQLSTQNPNTLSLRDIFTKYHEVRAKKGAVAAVTEFRADLNSAPGLTRQMAWALVRGKLTAEMSGLKPRDPKLNRLRTIGAEIFAEELRYNKTLSEKPIE